MQNKERQKDKKYNNYPEISCLEFMTIIAKTLISNIICFLTDVLIADMTQRWLSMGPWSEARCALIMPTYILTYI